MTTGARRAVVTGSSGLLGRRIVERMLGDGWEVTGVDSRPPAGGGPAGAVLLERDLASGPPIDDILAGADVLVHAAAIADLGRGTGEAEVYALNTASTMAVYLAAERVGVPRIVYASSQSVLGLSRGPGCRPPSFLPIDETHPCRPRDGYALSKLAGEEAGRMIARRSGMTVVALRLPVVWEPDRFPEHVAKRAGDPDQAARSNWAYVDVRDAAAGVALAASAPLDGFRLFNLSAARPFCDRPIRDLVAERYGDVPGAATLEPDRTLFDFGTAAREIGFRPRYAWSGDGIDDSEVRPDADLNGRKT